MKKLLSVVLSVVLALSLIAGCFAEDTAIPQLNDSDVLVVVNGVNITWGDVSAEYDMLVNEYGSYYDLTTKESVDLFRAVALNDIVIQTLTRLNAEALGLAPLTAEETAAAEAEAKAEWDEVIDSYAVSMAGITEESTEEEKAAARADGEAYILENYGYTPESFVATYVSNVVDNRLYDYYTKDITVTDADVQAQYDALVEADKQLYGEDLEGYCSAVANAEMMAYYTYMYTGEYSVEYPHYKPAGFRAVKHVLLAVDETALNEYNELTATFEEQQNPSEATEPVDEAPETTEAPAEPVTQEMIDAAAQAIIDANAETIKAVQDAYANGEDFDTLIANYSKDSGNTYEVCAYSETSYVKPFVTAAMSIEKVGELSQPTLSEYGIHIVLYVADVEAGPVVMTAEEMDAMRADLLSTMKSEAYSAGIDAFQATATIEYTGLVTPIDVLQAEEEAGEDVAEEIADEVVEPAEETTEEPAEQAE